MRKNIAGKILVASVSLTAAALSCCGDNRQVFENVYGQTKEGNDVVNAPTFIATVYYVDDETAEIIWKDVKVSSEYEIWDALKETGILTDDCELLSLKANEDNNTLDLDFNSATGDRIRSMGTAGETEIIGCISNTYLETYSASGIKLIEEGKALETSHGVDMSGYNGIMSF